MMYSYNRVTQRLPNTTCIGAFRQKFHRWLSLGFFVIHLCGERAGAIRSRRNPLPHVEWNIVWLCFEMWDEIWSLIWSQKDVAWFNIIQHDLAWSKPLSKYKGLGKTDPDRMACVAAWRLMIHGNAATSWLNRSDISGRRRVMATAYSAPSQIRSKCSADETISLCESYMVVFGKGEGKPREMKVTWFWLWILDITAQS